MKQLVQSVKNGQLRLAEVPVPGLKENHVLIETSVSVISAGTEKMLVDFGKSSLPQKIMSRPEEVRRIWEKVNVDGVASTFHSVVARFEDEIPLGYSNCGKVVAVGQGVKGLSIGDRVVSNGPHSEFVSVPEIMCSIVPNNLQDDQAAFGMLGAVALQGVRLAAPTIGETFVVFGLGAIGILAAQILIANGCQVIGVDKNPSRIELASTLNIKSVSPESLSGAMTNSQMVSSMAGADGVVIATSTSSDDVISLAASVCRKRARLVLVGTAGLNISRRDFYEKELTFQVSASFGPGKYDEDYEKAGRDYPLPYVRWTARRNVDTVLSLLSNEKICVKPLLSASFPFEKAADAYQQLFDDPQSITMSLKYGQGFEAPMASKQHFVKPDAVPVSAEATANAETDKARIGIVGAGNYAGVTLLPILSQKGLSLESIVSEAGFRASALARRFRIREAGSDANNLFISGHVNTVFIVTRHENHASLAMDAIRAGLHVYLEKPLALRLADVEELSMLLASASRRKNQIFTLGFNRRFSRHVELAKGLFADISGPKKILYMVNAGQLPQSHWLLKRDVGGGRIIGEACHFLDLMRFFIGYPVVDWHHSNMDSPNGDSQIITVKFADGSVGILDYSSVESKRYPKEKIQISAEGKTLIIDNFRKTTGFGWKSFKTFRTFRQDKGHRRAVEVFLRSVDRGGPDPIPLEEIFEVSRLSIQIEDRNHFGGNH